MVEDTGLEPAFVRVEHTGLQPAALPICQSPTFSAKNPHLSRRVSRHRRLYSERSGTFYLRSSAATDYLAAPITPGLPSGK